MSLLKKETKILTHYPKYLKAPTTVPFDKIYIDPNNPRITPESEGRYDEPKKIFDSAIQRELTTRTYDVYKAKELEDAIVGQGWVPIDPIIVWEHPDRAEHYIVVEGNTRTSVLRSLREKRIGTEKLKLERFERKSSTPADEVRAQRELVDRIESIIEHTKQLPVVPVNAPTLKELEKVLPRILGVRHVKHAQQWSPFATNTYIATLYKRLFTEAYGHDTKLRLDDDLIREVGKIVSLGPTKTKRNIQSALAFAHFKRHYEERLPEDEEFVDRDQYFFELIVANPTMRRLFGFGDDQYELSAEGEEALFIWAFSKPRTAGDDDENNVFRKAEDIRLLNTMVKYDTSEKTSFGDNFDVSAPEDTRKTMADVEVEFLSHRAQKSPVSTLESLLTALKKLPAETLVTQGAHLLPIIDQIGKHTRTYKAMIEANDVS